MEGTPRHEGGNQQGQNEQQLRPLVWNEYDQLPEHSAWHYVTDQETLAAEELRGAWVPADLDAHRVAMVVSSAVGQPVARAELVVIDQVGIETMVDEDIYDPSRDDR